MNKKLNIFGVRHLSPGASYHLIRLLEEKRPKCILIEGPADAKDMLCELADKKVKPPVAFLAYTTKLPIETILYPFAGYSPEYQAICWGMKQKSEIRFIDIPCNVFLKIRQEQTKELPIEKQQEFYRFHNNLYENLARQYGEHDYESYWERNFEHNLNKDAYSGRLNYQSAQIREIVIDREFADVPYDFSYNLIREAFMRREIKIALDDGFKPEDIVILVGAYHISGLVSDLPPMSDEDFNSLPLTDTRSTLMPYSYHRLSSRTGYGAGNKAPFYFELMWKHMQEDTLDVLPATYLSMVASELRSKGYNASSASVIEAVRLAGSLTSLYGGSLPVLKDLHDAVITCFGGGELSPVAEAVNLVDIGTAIGQLPEGVSQTPVQEDMNQELKKLKLTRYKSAVAQDLSLDLRENLKVKTKEAAFIDLNRSTLLHRLQVLNIHFAQKQRVSQDSATWAEKWTLRWTPETEIEIVEANLKGETLEMATAFELREQLENCNDISRSALIVRQACECNLSGVFDNAVSTLQSLLVDSNNFRDIVFAAHELSLLIQYGGLRLFNSEPLIPILQQLFLRASLLLTDASSCDEKASVEVAKAINIMDLISQEQYEIVDWSIWQQELHNLAWRDNLNSKLSGLAFSLLLEHNLVNEDDCSKEVSRRLSPGIPADLGAGWFEGLSGRNRYALLSGITLWKELDNYIRSLDEEEFLRSVVFLRRAFGEFESGQKNSIAELLGDIWGTDAESTAEYLQSELTEKENLQLDELNNFDFDF